jgi:hypothetical protein
MTGKQINRADRLRGLLWGAFVGDALAMPVHWYYNIAALTRLKPGEEVKRVTLWAPSSLREKNTIGVKRIGTTIKGCRLATIPLIYCAQGYCCDR